MLQYNVYYRPPLSRNKYGFVNEAGTIIGGNSLFSNTNNAVGGAMATLEELSEFIGATQDYDGQKGLVPAPTAGNQLHFLQATGAWVDIPAYRYIKRWPFDEGLPESGIGVEGDFHVSDTLSTLNLNVEGQAHFWELVIDKAKANGGQIIVSPSLFQIDYLGEVVVHNIVFNQELRQRTDIMKYINREGLTKVRCRRLWMNNDDGVDRTFAETMVGDMMRCQTFNLDGHTTEGGLMKDVSNTVYWTYIVEQGTGMYTDENGNEKSGLYIDLAFAFTTNNPRAKYYPISTLFQDDQDEPVIIPDNFVPPQLYDDLKEWAFDTLCGSTSVTPELIEDEATLDEITELVFQIRGVTYIVAGILGVDYVDDSYASLYSMLEGSGIGNAILFGSDDDQLEDVVNQIMGVDDTDYSELMIYQDSYLAGVTDAILNGSDNFTPNENGEVEPSYNGGSIAYEDRGNWLFGYGTFEPRKGQQLACLGHLWDKDRQNAVVISSIQSIDPELVPPSIAQYTGIDSFGGSISQYRMSVIAKNGNVFTGKFMVRNNGAYMDIDDVIGLYITDIETGLETVGIHLDGANSTITMKGSVELHQHDGGENDTLSVWDANEMKKVEIMPTTIPAINNIVQTTSTQYTGSSNPLNAITIPSSYIKETSHKTKDHWFGSDEYEYQYYQNIPIQQTISGTITLGKYGSGDTIDITNVKVYVNLIESIWAASEEECTLTFRNNESYPAVLTLTLKDENNNTYKNETYNITNLPLNTKTYTFITSSFVNDYTLSNVSNRKFNVAWSLSFYMECGETRWRDTRYGEGARKYYAYYSYSSYASAAVTSPSASFMQIGTNGLVYSVGNGDYFYSGDSGFAMQYHNNGIKMTSDFGMRLYKVPQTINNETSDKTVKSEIVICEPAQSGYTVQLPTSIVDGEEITIIGYKGLKVRPDSNRVFSIYRSDVGNYYNAFEEITLEASSSPTYFVDGNQNKMGFKVNNNKLQIIAAPGRYILISDIQ